MADSSLDTLACAVDVAVRDRDSVMRPSDEVLSRACRASDAYFAALRDESFEVLRHVEAAPYSPRAETKAYADLETAREHLCLLREVGPALRLQSEWLRAQAMEERCEMIWREYADKWAALSEAKRDGNLKRVRGSVTNARIRTGYKLIDGVRVPIVEATR